MYAKNNSTYDPDPGPIFQDRMPGTGPGKNENWSATLKKTKRNKPKTKKTHIFSATFFSHNFRFWLRKYNPVGSFELGSFSNVLYTYLSPDSIVSIAATRFYCFSKKTLITEKYLNLHCIACLNSIKERPTSFLKDCLKQNYSNVET